MAVERKSLSILFFRILFAIVFVAVAVSAIVVVRFYLYHGVKQAHSLVCRINMPNVIRQFQCDSHRRSNTYDFVNLLTYRHGNVVDKWILVLFNRQ